MNPLSLLNKVYHQISQGNVKTQYKTNKRGSQEVAAELDSLRHSLWHLRRQISFQIGTWCWLTQTVLAHASAQASSSETPQTVTQVSIVGSLDNAPTFFSILFDVQTLSQTKISSELFSRPLALFNLCSSALLFFILHACPAIIAGIDAPNRDHHGSTIALLFSTQALGIYHQEDFHLDEVDSCAQTLETSNSKISNIGFG